jgi:hypothetical protein
LIAARERIAAQRQRLDRIAARYAQLDEALDNLESLAEQLVPAREILEPADERRPRKPR